MKFSDFTDNRNKRVVFVNNCLLNQTSRAPGVAFREGAATELVQVFLDHNLSIQQLPCLECIGIGGVSRKTFDRYFPLISHSLKHGWFPILKLIFKVLLFSFKRLCNKKAAKVVGQMVDYLTEGYSIAGVVGMNDSPTCGVTKTLDFIEFTRLLTLAEETGNTPKDIIQQTLVEGTSYFMGSMMKESKKRGIEIKWVGYEPWTDDPQKEAERIATYLEVAV